MSEAPDLELIKACLDRLRADATLVSLLGPGDQIFDRVPETKDGKTKVRSPYISLGPTTSIPDDYDCRDGEEITFQLDAWSWGHDIAYSSAEVRRIAAAMKRSLHNAEIVLTDNALVTLTHELTRILRDPDGVTNHAAVQFVAVVEIY